MQTSVSSDPFLFLLLCILCLIMFNLYSISISLINKGELLWSLTMYHAFFYSCINLILQAVIPHSPGKCPGQSSNSSSDVKSIVDLLKLGDDGVWYCEGASFSV